MQYTTLNELRFLEKINETNVSKITQTLNQNFEKGLISEELCENSFKELDNLIEKAGNHKYFKREGSPGNYKYYYTEEEYRKAKGGEKEKGSKGSLVEGDSVSYQKTKGAGLKIPFKGEVISIDKDGKYAQVRNSIGDIDYVPVSDLKRSSGVESKSQDVGKSISIKKDLPYMTVTEKLKGQKLIVTGSRTVNFASGPKKYYTVKDEKGNEHEIRAEYVDDAKKEKKPAEKKEDSQNKLDYDLLSKEIIDSDNPYDKELQNKIIKTDADRKELEKIIASWEEQDEEDGLVYTAKRNAQITKRALHEVLVNKVRGEDSWNK